MNLDASLWAGTKSAERLFGYFPSESWRPCWFGAAHNETPAEKKKGGQRAAQTPELAAMLCD